MEQGLIRILRVMQYTKILRSSGGKTESSLYLGSNSALPDNKIRTASNLNARRFIAVEEGVEVRKNERVEGGGLSGVEVRENK